MALSNIVTVMHKVIHVLISFSDLTMELVEGIKRHPPSWVYLEGLVS